MYHRNTKSPFDKLRGFCASTKNNTWYISEVRLPKCTSFTELPKQFRVSPDVNNSECLCVYINMVDEK